MAYTRLKMVKGRLYREVVESYREGGKVRHHYLEYIGAAEPSETRIARNRTFALGINKLNRYELEFKIVEAEQLVISHDPFIFTPNPNYPPELQPRIRDRADARLQVLDMAAKLEPDALLRDFKSLDRGAPIVGKDNIIESGNGRIMSILLAANNYPQIYLRYRNALKAVAPGYSLPIESVDRMKVPVLVRERLTEVGRMAFVEECNNSTTLQNSPVENAKSDAAKLSPDLLISLEVLEEETITDSIRSPRNKHIVSSFLSKLPANEQAHLLDTNGILNQPGVTRMVTAMFVAVFKSSDGLRLGERFFESTDVNVRSCFNGITRSLAILAYAETLISQGYRQGDYSIGEDLAKAITELIIIKNTTGLSVVNYLTQGQLFERSLTPFQEIILVTLDKYCRSAKQIAAILSCYSHMVIDSSPSSQKSLLPDTMLTKEQLFQTAVQSAIPR
jgi:hypothetical protein